MQEQKRLKKYLLFSSKTVTIASTFQNTKDQDMYKTKLLLVLYDCETWPPSLREEYKLQENIWSKWNGELGHYIMNFLLYKSNLVL
jgi:hypothetical protein